MSGQDLRRSLPQSSLDLPNDSYLYANEGFCPTMFVVELDTDKEAIVEANSRDGFNMSKDLDFDNVQINIATNHVECKSSLGCLSPVISRLPTSYSD